MSEYVFMTVFKLNSVSKKLLVFETSGLVSGFPELSNETGKYRSNLSKTTQTSWHNRQQLYVKKVKKKNATCGKDKSHNLLCQTNNSYLPTCI